MQLLMQDQYAVSSRIFVRFTVIGFKNVVQRKEIFMRKNNVITPRLPDD
jgi:hypothetical protein